MKRWSLPTVVAVLVMLAAAVPALAQNAGPSPRGWVPARSGDVPAMRTAQNADLQPPAHG